MYALENFKKCDMLQYAQLSGLTQSAQTFVYYAQL